MIRILIMLLFFNSAYAAEDTYPQEFFLDKSDTEIKIANLEFEMFKFRWLYARNRSPALRELLPKIQAEITRTRHQWERENESALTSMGYVLRPPAKG